MGWRLKHWAANLQVVGSNPDHGCVCGIKHLGRRLPASATTCRTFDPRRGNTSLLVHPFTHNIITTIIMSWHLTLITNISNITTNIITIIIISWHLTSIINHPSFTLKKAIDAIYCNEASEWVSEWVSQWVSESVSQCFLVLVLEDLTTEIFSSREMIRPMSFTGHSDSILRLPGLCRSALPSAPRQNSEDNVREFL